MATRTRSEKLVSPEDQLARRISDRIDAEAEAIGQAMGPPAGSDRYTSRETDALWDTPDHTLDQASLFQALQQGITPEGAQAVALFRMSPELAKHVTSTPLPSDQAAAIVKLAEYPGRYVLTANHSHDPRLQVEYVAEQQHRATRRAVGSEARRAARPEPGAVPPEPGGS